MATLSTYGKRGDRFRVVFRPAGGGRKTLWLGQVTRKQAENVRRGVDALLAAREAGGSLDRQTLGWLADLSPGLRAKLAAAGLVEEKRRVTVAELVADFLASRSNVKPGTMVNLRQATDRVVEFLGADKLVEDVNEADAEEFYRGMLTAELAEATARRRAGRARELFTFAVRKRYIATNPFMAVKVASGGNKARQVYVSVETIRAVLDACPDAEWRLIVALSRFAGLRCPSEHLVLTWEDVNWERMRFRCDSPKTGPRVVPIFAELEPFLREAFELAAPGQVHVVTRNRGDGRMGNALTTNWSTQLKRIIKRAGVAPWPKLTHNLRASCQTDLANRFPAHVVCGWLGNSEAVAQKHYLQTTEEHYRSASQIASHDSPRQETPQAAGSNVASENGGSRRPAAGCDANRVTLTGSELPHDSQQETHEEGPRITERITLDRILALAEHLSPAGRAELARRLAEREVRP